jgi:hypothetical protein
LGFLPRRSATRLRRVASGHESLPPSQLSLALRASFSEVATLRVATFRRAHQHAKAVATKLAKRAKADLSTRRIIQRAPEGSEADSRSHVLDCHLALRHPRTPSPPEARFAEFRLGITGVNPATPIAMRGIGARFVYVLRSDSNPARHYVGRATNVYQRLAGGALRAVPQIGLRTSVREAALLGTI